MILFDVARDKAAAIGDAGRQAVEAAKRAGVPACYLDPASGDGVIREYPDGRRECLSSDRS